MNDTHLIKPVLDAEYPVVDYGKGVFLYDREGKKYLDASSGAITANIGHGVMEIIEAMDNQSRKVSFVYRSQFTSEAAENLAAKLASLAPGDLNWCFFVNSGSEATETAMKMAIQYWQEQGRNTKTRILSRWVSYHGITLGALSLSGHPARRARFEPLLEDSPVIHPPYCYRCPYQLEPETCGSRCAEELDTVISRIGSERIAAFIAEPIIGAAGGAITPPKDYYKVLKKICEKHEVLFIADEVMTGFGRTGTLLACEHWGIIPDIAALGKGMGAGYTAIAATIASDKVLEPIQKGSKVVMSGHTLSANPQSCAVSLAVLDYLDQNKIMEGVRAKGDYLLKKLSDLKEAFPFVGDIRGKGLLIGIEFVTDKVTKKPFNRSELVTQNIVGTAAKMGLLLYPAGAGLDGIHGDSILIAPPLTITESELDECVNLLHKTFSQFQQTL